MRLAETQRSGENGPSALSGLHGPRDEAPSVTHALDMVEDGDLRVSGQNKVAMHTVDGEIGGYGPHGRGKGLGYRGSAIDTACPWRMPEGTSIGEYILFRGTLLLVNRRGVGVGKRRCSVVIPARCQRRASIPERFRSAL